LGWGTKKKVAQRRNKESGLKEKREVGKLPGRIQ